MGTLLFAHRDGGRSTMAEGRSAWRSPGAAPAVALPLEMGAIRVDVL
jgi:hypothetical protein